MLKLLLADATELPSDESLSNDICCRLVARVLHIFVEAVALMEASDKALHLYDDSLKESHLTASKRFMVVVLLAANRTGARLASHLCYSLERFQTVLVEYVRAAQYLLLLHLQIFEANRARIIFQMLCPLKKLDLNLLPFPQAKRQVRLLLKTQLLSE